jgi:biotin transporter BioY
MWDEMMLMSWSVALLVVSSVASNLKVMNNLKKNTETVLIITVPVYIAHTIWLLCILVIDLQLIEMQS